MNAVHDPECEKAEPGSLCDCDCAGARHAVRNSPGNAPAAGSVSRRARKIAERDGRAPVVNRLPGGTATTRTGRQRPPAEVSVPDRRPDPVKLTDPPAPKLSPAVKAQLRKVRAGLPKTRGQWRLAALEAPSPAVTAANAARVDELADLVADTERLMRANEAFHAAAEAKKILSSKDGKRGLYGTPEQVREQARTVAPHRSWDDPAWQQLRDRRSALLAALDTARRVAAADNRAYPVDPGTGLRMPSKALQSHLKAVTGLGRDVLADARRAWEKDPPRPVRDAQELLDRHARAAILLHALNRRGLDDDVTGTLNLSDGSSVDITSDKQFDDLLVQAEQDLRGDASRLKEARRTVAKHQADTLRAVLASARAFGGTHTDVIAERDDTKYDKGSKFDVRQPREDWRARLNVAEQHFPADWITGSAQLPLRVGASGRAYYSDTRKVLSMNIDEPTDDRHDGALHYVDEVTVHEMGHRMETVIPGLTHLEFAYVRQRATDDTGRVEKIRSLGYQDASEVAQWDRWGAAYAGKTYEGGSETPGDQPWEVFQVGLQDTFGRSTRTRYGPVDDPEELQAFVIGALLAL